MTPSRAAHFGKQITYTDVRMKQAQSETTGYRSAGLWRLNDPTTPYWRRANRLSISPGDREPAPPESWSAGQVFMLVCTGIWYVVTLPFRLVFWGIAWLGRLTAVVLGFSLMVLGMALWAGPLFFIGIPLFLVGLVLTLRCLD